MKYYYAYEDAFGIYLPLFLELGGQDVKLHFYHWNGRTWYPDEALFDDEEHMDRVWGVPNVELTQEQKILIIKEIFEKFVWEEI